MPDPLPNFDQSGCLGVLRRVLEDGGADVDGLAPELELRRRERRVQAAGLSRTQNVGKF